jgi:hypothetical protein
LRLYLLLHGTDGRLLARDKIELPALPEPGTVLRPPISRIDCFVTRAVPASIEGTGDLRIAGTVYADVTGPLEAAETGH